MQAWNRFLSSRPAPLPAALPQQQSMAALRERTVALLSDCEGPTCERLRHRLQAARSANDLWLARSEIFQQVASQHCQAQAAQRIDGLLPLFEGWLPARMLTPVGATIRG
jgi:hypothetical protein